MYIIYVRISPEHNTPIIIVVRSEFKRNSVPEMSDDCFAVRTAYLHRQTVEMQVLIVYTTRNTDYRLYGYSTESLGVAQNALASPSRCACFRRGRGQ